MLKRLSKYIKIVFLFLSIVSCENTENKIHKSTDGSVKKYTSWFAKDANFENKEIYKTKFISAYTAALKQNDFKKANELLLSAFQIMYISGNYDSYYVALLYDYLKKHESKIAVDDLLTFYNHIGGYETYNGDYQKCISILQKATLLEPYNYQSYSEKGNVYYYISYSYFNLGDVDNALKENENAIACFNKTDNYTGKALVTHHKATLSFDSGNELEGINAIDKTIKIYKKINDIDGLVSASINKYEFIDDNLQKAYPLLDTISNLINSGKVKSDFNILHFYTLKHRKYIKEKNIAALDKLVPEMERLANKINLPYWNDEMLVFKSQYDVLKYKKIINKDKLLALLDYLKKNKDISFASYILKILRDEAVANNDVNKVLVFSQEIEANEKKIREEDIAFKVKTFEKKIDTAKKEKTIAQQKTKLTKSYTYILALIGMLFLLVAVFWVISLKRKKALAIFEQEKQEQFTFQLLQNTEEERNRIANELHDSVNHDLLNIKNKLINAQNETSVEVEKVINEVRNISRNLYPAVLETIGLEASIENLCERITDNGLFTTCDINYQQKLSKNKELQIYRIIQEALNNTLKHGKANAAKVILTSEENSLHIEVKDNGNGFDVNEQLQNPKSFGLQSIMQRAKAIAAHININSTNKGTIILLKIPV